MGFERMCCVLQQKSSVYDTDLFVATVKVIEQYTQLTYATLSPVQLKRFRIIADHARTAFMLINDGLIPSNIAAGYVLRMIIRRMVYNIMLLKEISLEKYADFLRDLLASFEGLRVFKESEIIRVLLEEIRLFHHTLQKGTQILQTMITAH
jgi:alanyl-tRNA synthetase